MRIELSATPNWLKISWSAYEATIEAEILRRLQTVSGAMGNGRRWYAPVSQLWLLTELFDKASYQYEAMCAADAFDKPINASVQPSTSLTDDERLGPLFRGIQNAKKKAEEDRVKYPKRRRKQKAKQGELWA